MTRSILSVACIGILTALPQPLQAQSQAFPSRQMQIVVPFPPGGSADYFARTVFNKLGPELGQTIVFENVAGAGGVVGTKNVIKAAPDGHTLLVSAVASVIIPPILTDPPAFDALKELTPITGIGTVPAVLVVKPALGPKSFAELLAHLKANPGKLNLATSGNGTISHLTGELMMRETGTRFVAVHYRGAPPAVTDLIGGHIDLMFSDAPFFLEHITAGKLVPIAIGTERRAHSLPTVPTTAELGFPGILASNTYSLFGPAGLPPAIVSRLNTLVRKAIDDPEIKTSFERQAALSAGDSPERFSALIRAEADRWVPLVKAAGVKGN